MKHINIACDSRVTVTMISGFGEKHKVNESSLKEILNYLGKLKCM